MLRIAIVSLALLLISACCSAEYVEVPQVVKVAILPMPELPTLSAEQNDKIPIDAYEVLAEREETLVQHIKAQKRLLELNNARAPDN